MNFLLFLAPFLGHPRARGRCSQGERVLYGRDLCRSGGTGKAEAVKLPGRRNWPEAVLYKGMSRETLLPRPGAENFFSRHSARLISEWSLSGIVCVFPSGSIYVS